MELFDKLDKIRLRFRVRIEWGYNILIDDLPMESMIEVNKGEPFKETILRMVERFEKKYGH